MISLIGRFVWLFIGREISTIWRGDSPLGRKRPAPRWAGAGRFETSTSQFALFSETSQRRASTLHTRSVTRVFAVAGKSL